MPDSKKLPFEPLIKTSKTTNNTLHDKNVTIKGVNDFGRSHKSSAPNISPSENTVKNSSINHSDSRLVATKTAKVSPDVLLKLNTLKPFIKDLEEMDKTSINSIIDMLIESYINSKLTVRQSEGFKTMYKNLFDLLPK